MVARVRTLAVTLVALVAGCVAASAGLAQSPKPPPEKFPAELDRYIATVLSEWQIPGLAIARVRNDSTLVAKGYGVRALGKPERVDENNVLDIAPLGKSVTA